MRSLGPDEAALWAQVTASIRPLSREISKDERNTEAAESRIEPDAPSRRLPPSRPIAAPAKPRQGTTLDGSWDKRVKSGAVQPDRIVDLHGLNLDRAWRSVEAALERSIHSGDRVLLLITGHERRGEPPIERGRIRAAVHDWLAASPHAAKIAAVRGAHRRHGGGGSLYIIFRRR